MYDLLRNLLAPAALKDKSFKELVIALKSHFKPKPLIIAEQFKFHQRGQAPGETVAEYVAELRRLATHCEFGAYLDEVLRARFVCGLKEEGTQKALLTETELSFAKAVDVAQGREAAARNARQLQEMLPSTQEVNKVSAGEGTNYYRCGKGLSMSHDLSRVLQLWKKRTHSGRLASPTPGPIYPKPQPKK